MASETVDPIDWSHTPPSWAVPPERHVHSINQCNLSGTRTCNRSMRGNHLANAATQGIIYIVPNTLFSQNLMIIITGTFRNTSILLKLYEITLFPTGLSAYQIIIQFTKEQGHHYADDPWTSSACHGLNFHRRDLKFSDKVRNTITIVNWN